MRQIGAVETKIVQMVSGQSSRGVRATAIWRMVDVLVGLRPKPRLDKSAIRLRTGGIAARPSPRLLRILQLRNRARWDRIAHAGKLGRPNNAFDFLSRMDPLLYQVLIGCLPALATLPRSNRGALRPPRCASEADPWPGL